MTPIRMTMAIASQTGAPDSTPGERLGAENLLVLIVDHHSFLLRQL